MKKWMEVNQWFTNKRKLMIGLGILVIGIIIDIMDKGKPMGNPLIVLGFIGLLFFTNILISKIKKKNIEILTYLPVNALVILFTLYLMTIFSETWLIIFMFIFGSLLLWVYHAYFCCKKGDSAIKRIFSGFLITFLNMFTLTFLITIRAVIEL